MYRDKIRYGKDPSKVVRSKDPTFYKALKLKDPRMIFTCSWSDFFIEEADPWREDAWDVIRMTPQHLWQILTKRPERIKDNLPEDWGKNGFPNVWVGTTIENQDCIHRLKTVTDLVTNDTVFKTFLSCEPTGCSPRKFSSICWVG